MMNVFSSKIGVLFSFLSGAYLVYLFLTTYRVDVITEQPTDCINKGAVQPKRYDDSRFFAELTLKHRVKKAGGDTLYLDSNLSPLNYKKGRLSGRAYDCSGS